ncbi:GYF domain-containing protein [Marilutibacter maris]|uniref:PilA-related fimbrial protein n=3 Tax=Marilutibacter maris TaxID=1605891 RepID=A0A2U9T6J6_9GAMM|nr:GYF domain-containing protein [Lysobacter maris]AWV06118.1 PilA-related fimbrial protein [Lysobacter maris]
MTQWYYNDPARGQVGPLDGDRLREAWQRRELAADTLAWREGMSQWQPLSQLMDELGLDAAGGAAVPPPLPGAAPAPRTGLSGCAIVAIIGAVLLVPLLGILAAIAIPAYQDYTIRARVAQALIVAEPLKANVAAFAASEGRCPLNGEGGLGEAEDYAGNGLAAIHAGPFGDNGHCALELEFDGTGTSIDGSTLLLEARSGIDGDNDWDWRCGSDSLKHGRLPRHCRDDDADAY